MPRFTVVLAWTAFYLLASPAIGQTLSGSAPDQNDWLGKADDPNAVAWAAARTATALDRLGTGPVFAAVERELKEAEHASQPKPGYSLLGDKIVRFTRDAAHPRGVFAVTTARRGVAASAAGWRDVLDVDALDKREGSNLEVMFLDLSKTCLAPRFDRCLIPFGAGGSSMVQYREFDFASGDFVPGGFVTTPSRGGVAWLDRDTLLIAHANGPADLLPSGFPKAAYRWRRGTPLDTARPVLTAASTDAVVDVRSLGTNLPGSGIVLLAKDYVLISAES